MAAAVEEFLSLSPHLQAIVAIAVLLDGPQAAEYLESDLQNGTKLKAVAQQLSALEFDLRMPLLGTWLRVALQQLSSGNS